MAPPTSRPSTAFTGPERLALIVLCAAVFVINVSTTIVNITLPRLTQDLGASTEDLLWIVDSFNLVFAALVLAAGSLSDRFGRRRFLLLGLTLFAVASFGGATAGSPDALIAWRAAAGVGAAVIFPVTLSILSNIFTDRRRRAKAIGIWGATTGLAIAAGPVVGGFLVEHVSWNSTLVFPGTVAVLAFLGTLWRIPESRDPSTPPPDVGGIVLSTAGLGLLVYSLIEAPGHGWTSTATLGGLAGALLVLLVFTLWERRQEHPMLDVGLFANLRFTAASASITFAFFAMFGFIFLITQYFQFVKDYGAFESGLRILPFATCVGIASIVGSRVALALGTKLVVAGGLLLLATGFAWTSTASGTTDYTTIAAQMVLMGTGLGLTSAPATEAIMGVVPAAKAGVGSAVNDATRELGGTLGVAVIGSVSLSLYRDAYSDGSLPAAILEPARESIGSALTTASRLAAGGDGATASALVSTARTGYLDGLQAGCLVAAGVVVLGAILVLLWLPAHPGRAEADAGTDVGPATGTESDDDAVAGAGDALREGGVPAQDGAPVAGGTFGDVGGPAEVGAPVAGDGGEPVEVGAPVVVGTFGDVGGRAEVGAPVVVDVSGGRGVPARDGAAGVSTRDGTTSPFAGAAGAGRRPAPEPPSSAAAEAVSAQVLRIVAAAEAASEAIEARARRRARELVAEAERDAAAIRADAVAEASATREAVHEALGGAIARLGAVDAPEGPGGHPVLDPDEVREPEPVRG